MGRILDISYFCDLDLIVKVIGGFKAPLMGENIAYCTLCPQYLETYFMDSFQIWACADHG